MASSSITLLVALCAVMFAQQTYGECTGPSVTTDTYTTKSLSLSSLTAYVAEFTVACQESTAAVGSLYAEVEAGVLVPVAMGAETNSYQLSWTREHKMAAVGTIPVRMFTDEGLAEYRKAQRSEGSVSDVKSLFTITLEHSGSTSESWFVQTEFVAVLLCLGVFWTANSMRSQIVA